VSPFVSPRVGKLNRLLEAFTRDWGPAPVRVSEGALVSGPDVRGAAFATALDELLAWAILVGNNAARPPGIDELLARSRTPKPDGPFEVADLLADLADLGHEAAKLARPSALSLLFEPADRDIQNRAARDPLDLLAELDPELAIAAVELGHSPRREVDLSELDHELDNLTDEEDDNPAE